MSNDRVPQTHTLSRGRKVKFVCVYVCICVVCVWCSSINTTSSEYVMLLEVKPKKKKGALLSMIPIRLHLIQFPGKLN